MSESTGALSSNPVLEKWGKHRLKCPPDCMECEMRAEIERLTTLNANHRETLRGIRAMDAATEGDRMRQWASDALSGYVENAEVSLKSAQDEINGLLAALRRYGHHNTDCPERSGGVCNCGLSNVLSAASARCMGSPDETFARRPIDCKHERAKVQCPDCGIDFLGGIRTSPRDVPTPAMKAAGGRVLWEKQFEGTPWAGKVRLIRPDSMTEYEELAVRVWESMQLDRTSEKA